MKTPILSVTGGKGGTGKSTVAVNLAVELSKRGFRVLLADVDVDGPSCAILLGTKLDCGEEVRQFVPEVDPDKCNGCRKCVEACPEHALVGLEGQTPKLFEELCSGCRACMVVCPQGAISEGSKLLGKLYFQWVKGIRLITGELKPAEVRSAYVARATVLKAMDELKTGNYDLAIFDTAPGVHCAVAQPLWFSDSALVVTEPTPLGVHDLAFILDLAQELNLPAMVVLNKADIRGGLRDQVRSAVSKRGVQLVAEIPLDERLWEAYVKGEPVVERHPSAPSSQAFQQLAGFIAEKLIRK